MPRVVFPAAMLRGHRESRKINRDWEASGTVPGSELEGWDWGSPSWAAIKLLSVITSDIFPTGHQLGAVLQVTGRAEHPRRPAEVHRSSSCPRLPQIKAKFPPLAHPNHLEGLLVKARDHFQKCCRLTQRFAISQREGLGRPRA